MSATLLFASVFIIVNGQTQYETCVESTQLVSGVFVQIGRNSSDKTLEITITGQANKYSAIGFGAKSMSGMEFIYVNALISVLYFNIYLS